MSNATAVLINLIAFIHYYKMRNMYDSGDTFDLVQLRYSDWFLTCPLLLFEFFLLMEFIQVKNNKITVDPKYSGQIIATIVLTVLMLVFGYLSETKSEYKWAFYVLGFVCLLIIFLILFNLNNKRNKDDPNKKLPKYPWFFILIWVLYGLAFLAPARDLFYNILDLIAKGVFAFCVAVL